MKTLSPAGLDGAGLLRDIIEHPGQDAPRLIYADWLEETGADPDRAEFIRDQTLWLPGDRDVQLLAARPDWCPGFSMLGAARERRPDDRSFRVYHASPAGAVTRWRAGFLSFVQCPLQAWLDHGPALVQQHPIREVRLSGLRPARLAFLGHSVIWRWYELLPWVAPDESELPGGLFDAVHEGRAGRLPFDSEADAWEALSRGSIAWARKEAAR